MGLKFYFDTAVLGPVYEDAHRDLVMSASVAWDGGPLPDDARLEAVLQPWRWRYGDFALYRQTVDHPQPVLVQDMASVALDPEWSPKIDEVRSTFTTLKTLYRRCRDADAGSIAIDPSTPHRYTLALSQDERDEDPDLPNPQCWPDLLGQVSRWPGLMPYRLNLQIVLRVPTVAIKPDEVYFALPRTLGMEDMTDVLELLDGKVSAPTDAVPGIVAGQGEIEAHYAWADDAAKAPVAIAHVGGRAEPKSDPEAPLDLTTLWVNLGRDAKWTSHDAIAAMPTLVAEACDQPDLLFDAFSAMAATDSGKPEIASNLADFFDQQANRTGLIAFALSAWTLRYGALGRLGNDGAHPLTSVLSAALRDDYGRKGWHVLAAAFKGTPPLSQDALDAAIRAANAHVETGAPQLLTPMQLQDTTWMQGGLAFVREAARIFAWLTSDAGLFSIYETPWLEAVKKHADSINDSDAVDDLSKWWASEAREAYPLGASVRAAWCSAGESAPVESGATPTPTPLRAVVDRLRASAEADPKLALESLLTDVASNPVAPNLHLRRYLETSGIAADPILSNAFHAAFAGRIAALGRVHLDGNMRATAVPAGYPAAFGDPWPLDRVQDLMLPMDRPGHVDSDDELLQDLRRQIAGVGMLVRQREKSWKCLAAADVVFDAPDGTPSFRYKALAGQPPGFAGEMRTTMVAYNGEPWFDRGDDEALAVGYGGGGDPDGSALTPLRIMAPPKSKLPDLKFGQAYSAAPFLIGPGNALPAALADGHPARSIDALHNEAGLDGAAIQLLADRPWRYYLRRVPVGAPLLLPKDRDSLFSRRADVFPLAHEVLAEGTAIAGVDKHAPLTLLRPATEIEVEWLGRERQEFEIHPPEVDMMVWLRQWRAALAAETDGDRQRALKSALSASLAKWMQQVDAIAAAPDAGLAMPKFHDPAHDGYRVDIREIWPREQDAYATWVVAVNGASQAPDATTAPIVLEVASAVKKTDVLSIKPSEGKVVVSGLQAGRVYALCVSALVRTDRFAVKEGDVVQGRTVFAPSALFLGDTAAEDASGDIRFASRIVLAEVATSKLPKPTHENPSDEDPLFKALGTAFDGRMLIVAADFSAMPKSDWQYVRTFILERQRWRWNGRHIDIDTIDRLPTVSAGAGFAPDAASAKAFEDWAFDERALGDFVREYAASAANDPRTVLLREDMQSNNSAVYERYRLRARSRYAGLMKSAEYAERGGDRWRSFAMKFRPAAAVLPRPKVAMLLPLTGGYAAGDPLRRLACLVQMDETAFGQAGLPERIGLEAEMAGPDALLVRSAPESEVVLKVDAHGPLGHSFDPDAPGALYRRASWVASFRDPSAATEMAAVHHPWAMVKLRVRREVPADWVWPVPDAVMASEWVSAGWIQLPRPSDQILLSDLPPTPASELRVLRDAGRGRVAIVRKAGKPDALKLVREPGFDVMFAVLTYRARDARGLPGAEQILVTRDAAIGDDGRTWIDVDGLELATIGSLRLRLLSVQRNPKDRHGNAWTCHSLSDLFARVGEEETSDARFRLMRVSFPIEEI